METIVRNVSELDLGDRSLLERVIGHTLRENEQLVIQVTSPPTQQVTTDGGAPRKLPSWCNVYEGLSDAEIDELDQAIVRTHSSRDQS